MENQEDSLSIGEVYVAAKRASRSILRGGRHSMNTTQLLHEAFASLLENDAFESALRSDPERALRLLVAALRARLVDYLRSRTAAKRPSGSGRAKVYYDDGMQLLQDDPEGLMHVLDCVEQLREGRAELRVSDPSRFAAAVERAVVFGFTTREVGEQLKIPQKTAARWIKLGRDWLNLRLESVVH